ncbi:MFS transporter [Paenibacillus mucilaginosus]|uniref:Major facilitator superfamily MFS_1 n=1 Tax=Paenibacillus mucilaginosus (strain KNP414) TaxID=1036673 RepID=F8F994_PAEMK|nr:MFS transporter [Paenibacillus mucilaginosus]AEI43022.1 major facilitator superfamily MFS_1 [Paenibacillus mucilaginosus KNP414]MCG7215964.1 MFS transporter [Paenibacillus mucilaginosus]WDM24649.1 MFS transporter [Paenibacillus mucilaginosus]
MSLDPTLAGSRPALPLWSRHRFIALILLSGMILQTGIWIRNFAVLLYVTDRTGGDPFAITFIAIAEYAPIFLFSFLGGTLADRWRPKKTMVWCDLLSALSVFLILGTLLLGSWQAVFFSTLVSSILSQISQPSAMKLFKLHLPEPQIPLALSMYQTMMALFMMGGPVLGTWVYVHWGIYTAIGLMGTAFVLSALVLSGIQGDAEPEGSRPLSELWAEMRSALGYVRTNRILRITGVCFLLAGLGMGLVNPLGIFVIIEKLGLPKEDLQWLTGVNGAAMLIGGGLTIALTRKAAPQRILFAGMTVSVLAIAAIGMSNTLAGVLTAQFFCGLVLPGIQMSINALMLSHTEEGYIGRVNGLLSPLFMGSIVATMSVSGWLKSMLPLSVLYYIAAFFFAAATLIMLPILRASGEESRRQESSVRSTPS